MPKPTGADEQRGRQLALEIARGKDLKSLSPEDQFLAQNWIVHNAPNDEWLQGRGLPTVEQWERKVSRQAKGKEKSEPVSTEAKAGGTLGYLRSIGQGRGFGEAFKRGMVKGATLGVAGAKTPEDAKFFSKEGLGEAAGYMLPTAIMAALMPGTIPARGIAAVSALKGLRFLQNPMVSRAAVEAVKWAPIGATEGAVAGWREGHRDVPTLAKSAALQGGIAGVSGVPFGALAGRGLLRGSAKAVLESGAKDRPFTVGQLRNLLKLSRDPNVDMKTVSQQVEHLPRFLTRQELAQTLERLEQGKVPHAFRGQQLDLGELQKLLSEAGTVPKAPRAPRRPRIPTPAAAPAPAAATPTSAPAAPAASIPPIPKAATQASGGGNIGWIKIKGKGKGQPLAFQVKRYEDPWYYTTQGAKIHKDAVIEQRISASAVSAKPAAAPAAPPPTKATAKAPAKEAAPIEPEPAPPPGEPAAVVRNSLGFTPEQLAQSTRMSDVQRAATAREARTARRGLGQAPSMGDAREEQAAKERAMPLRPVRGKAQPVPQKVTPAPAPETATLDSLAEQLYSRIKPGQTFTRGSLRGKVLEVHDDGLLISLGKETHRFPKDQLLKHFKATLAEEGKKIEKGMAGKPAVSPKAQAAQGAASPPNQPSGGLHPAAGLPTPTLPKWIKVGGDLDIDHSKKGWPLRLRVLGVDPDFQWPDGQRGKIFYRGPDGREASDYIFSYNPTNQKFHPNPRLQIAGKQTTGKRDRIQVAGQNRPQEDHAAPAFFFLDVNTPAEQISKAAHAALDKARKSLTQELKVGEGEITIQGGAVLFRTKNPQLSAEWLHAKYPEFGWHRYGEAKDGWRFKGRYGGGAHTESRMKQRRWQYAFRTSGPGRVSSDGSLTLDNGKAVTRGAFLDLYERDADGNLVKVPGMWEARGFAYPSNRKQAREYGELVTISLLEKDNSPRGYKWTTTQTVPVRYVSPRNVPLEQSHPRTTTAPGDYPGRADLPPDKRRRARKPASPPPPKPAPAPAPKEEVPPDF